MSRLAGTVLGGGRKATILGLFSKGNPFLDGFRRKLSHLDGSPTKTQPKYSSCISFKNPRYGRVGNAGAWSLRLNAGPE